MCIGLYRDLAVGCDRTGAETWSEPTAFLAGAQVGAPPDIHNPAGQNWRLPPFNPGGLQDDAYGSFVDLIRANMRHAGAIRIDHVMGLQRLYCIPDGSPPADGAYLSYWLDDLTGILALESHRNKCLVVGEDLGTVPEGFREKMEACNILSYRVLFFEQDWENGGFLAPSQYPRLAIAVAGSHDLPTLIGWRQCHDIELKETLGLFPSHCEARLQREQRAREYELLIATFRGEGLLSHGSEISTDQFIDAAHSFLADTNSILVVAQLDDLLGEFDQVNLPATSIEHPNWRRKYGLPLEMLMQSNLDRRAGKLPRLRGSNSRRSHVG
jgi:4-alpha-glucanotransferase